MNKCPHCKTPPIGWLCLSISELPSQRQPFECRKCGGKSLLPKRQSWLLWLLTMGAMLGVIELLEGAARRLELSETVQHGARFPAAILLFMLLPKPLFRLFFKLQPVKEGAWVTRSIRYRRLSWILSGFCVAWALPSIITGQLLWSGEISHLGSLPVAAWIFFGLGIALILVTAFCWFVEKPTEKPKEVFVPRESAKFPPADAKPPGER